MRSSRCSRTPPHMGSTPRSSGTSSRAGSGSASTCTARTDRASGEVGAVEEFGEFAFPPMACFISAGARLMLAMLERAVTDAGGSYAFCDTDSMAFVSRRRGGLVPCPGGSNHTWSGLDAVRALTWDQVDAAEPPNRPSVTHRVHRQGVQPARGRRGWNGERPRRGPERVPGS